MFLNVKVKVKVKVKKTAPAPTLKQVLKPSIKKVSKPVRTPAKVGGGSRKGAGAAATIDETPKTPRSISKKIVKGGQLFTGYDPVASVIDDAKAFDDLFNE